MTFYIVFMYVAFVALIVAGVKVSITETLPVEDKWMGGFWVISGIALIVLLTVILLH